LESLFGNIAEKSTPSQKINTIADSLALIRTHPSPARFHQNGSFVRGREINISSASISE
jgi:hypothetical protein